MVGLSITELPDGSLRALLDHCLQIHMTVVGRRRDEVLRVRASFEQIDQPDSLEVHEFEISVKQRSQPVSRHDWDSDDTPYLPYGKMAPHRLDRADQAFAAVIRRLRRLHAGAGASISNRFPAPVTVPCNDPMTLPAGFGFARSDAAAPSAMAA